MRCVAAVRWQSQSTANAAGHVAGQFSAFLLICNTCFCAMHRTLLCSSPPSRKHHTAPGDAPGAYIDAVTGRHVGDAAALLQRRRLLFNKDFGWTCVHAQITRRLPTAACAVVLCTYAVTTVTSPHHTCLPAELSTQPIPLLLLRPAPPLAASADMMCGLMIQADIR